MSLVDLEHDLLTKLNFDDTDCDFSTYFLNFEATAVKCVPCVHAITVLIITTRRMCSAHKYNVLCDMSVS